MNLRIVDLNLLTVFDAIMQTRSVTKAGKRIGLSQSAVSHALIRLRHALKDELFVRTSDGMMPSPMAERIAEPVSKALAELQLAFEPQTFCPQEADLKFVVAVDASAEVLFTPALLKHVMNHAPSVRLELRPAIVGNVGSGLDNGEIDLAIVATDDIRERFSYELLLEDRFVVIVRRDHPATGPRGTRISTNAFRALRFLEVNSSGTTEVIRRWFADRGITYNVAHHAPLLAVTAILAQSDMATIGRRMASRKITHGNARLKLLEFPTDPPRVREYMVWHRRLDNVQSHRWLRDLVVTISRTYNKP